MADGDIDFSEYSVEQLVAMLKRIDQYRHPLDYVKARRTLLEKWPGAPDDLNTVTAENLPVPRVPMELLPGGTRRFSVHFGPPGRPTPGRLKANDQGLRGTGCVEVGPASVTFAELRGDAVHKTRGFALADVANVECSEIEGVVVVRTRNDQRFVTLWLHLPEEAAALKNLLPPDITPGFVAQRQHEEDFAARLRAVAPHAVITPTLIGLNVLLFVVMLMAGAGMIESNPLVHVRFGSNFGPYTWTGEPWRLLTSAFLHFGVFHIAFNMYALYNGGMLTERLYGSGRFLVIYLLAAVSGSVVSGWWDAERNSAGASGAVFGVYGALLVFFAVRRQDIPVRLLHSAGKGALALCGYSLVIGATNPVIDNACHVGGLLGGAAAGWLLARPFNPEARSLRRPGRVAGTAFVVCAALALLAMPLWRPGGDRHTDIVAARLIHEFAPDEERLVNLSVEIFKAVGANKLTPSRAAERLQREVIEPWQAISRPLLALKPGVGGTLKISRLAALQRYLVERERALRMAVSLLTGSDEFTEQQLEQQWQRVAQLIKQLQAPDTP
jgi:rhomboid protease GluP